MSNSDPKDVAAAKLPDPPEVGAEEELYEEPPRMTVGDTIGVVVALLALLVIGWLGYLWLTPGKSMADALRFGRGSEMAGMTKEPAEQAAAAPSELKCAHCGMFADKSRSRIAARFSDGSQQAFDSWGCAFGYAGDNGVSFELAQVVDYTGSLDEPVWLDAADATYLYETAQVAGSMPPYVAAFADADAARSHMQDMVGELLSFTELQAKWPVMEQPMSGEMAGHEHGATATGSGEPMDHSAEAMEMAGMAGQAATPEEPQALEPAAALDQPHLHDHEFRCAYCGMFADKSPSQVVGYWTDGSHTHHDCWDCLFNYAGDNGTKLDYALVKLYNSSLDQPEWAKAASATYLYGTNPIRGSMPPFVAAFASRADAEAAAAGLGGELLTYKELASKWM